MALDTLDKILDFAIGEEENAARLYTNLAGRMDCKHMREVFLAFADEERGHKAKLLQVREGKQMLKVEQRVLDLKIGDYLESVKLSADIDYQDALIMAMKAEKAAFRMYSDLALAADDPALKATLLGLAQEEAKHKLRFEIEYDDNFLKEN
ncbi:MAG: ferritin family protein [Phycisphaerae bacterium]|nr:ferritin family protein [Phycisphaerae bacterium]